MGNGIFFPYLAHISVNYFIAKLHIWLLKQCAEGRGLPFSRFNPYGYYGTILLYQEFNLALAVVPLEIIERVVFLYQKIGDFSPEHTLLLHIFRWVLPLYYSSNQFSSMSVETWEIALKSAVFLVTNIRLFAIAVAAIKVSNFGTGVPLSLSLSTRSE